MRVKLKGALRSDFKLLPIGARVSYHHRAGVARFKRHANSEDKRRGWILVHGTLPGPEYVIDGLWNRVKDMFFDWPQASMRYPTQKINKTVMVWPEDGFGWIMGVMRKSIGESSSGYRSSSYYGEEYEPGYHSTLMYVDLYVVKVFYEGTSYVLCPLWAVREVKDED